MRDNQPRLCGVCSMVGHMYDMCPNLNEGIDYEQVNALREYQRQQISKEHLSLEMTFC